MDVRLLWVLYVVR